MTSLDTYEATPAVPQATTPNLFYDRPNQSITQLFQQEAARVTAPILSLTHEQMLDHLLEQVGPIDFRERAGLRDDRDKLTTMHYTVVTIREVLSLATHNTCGLCYRQGFLHSYNG